MPPTTQRPSVMASAAGPSHGSMTELQYWISALWLSGVVCELVSACGTSIILTIGAVRPARTITSNTVSSVPLSDRPTPMTGFRSCMCAPKAGCSIRVSCAFIQLTLPFSVLISPLWASMRNGWASGQVGKVLVE